MPKGKKREENLLAKIAAVLDKPVEEIKEAKATYTEEEAIYEAQSVYNYFTWRKNLVRQKGESDRIWEARQRVWQTKECEGCHEPFAYSYHYDGVKFCSLDCLRGVLKKQGITFNYARPLHLRYGYQKPGIVPAIALKSVESAFSVSYEEHDDHDTSFLPTPHQIDQSEDHSATA